MRWLVHWTCWPRRYRKSGGWPFGPIQKPAGRKREPTHVTPDQVTPQACRELDGVDQPGRQEGAARLARLEDGERRRGIDPWIVIVSLLLLAVGVAIIYSTSQSSSPVSDPLYYVKHQLLYAGAGLLVFVVAASIDYHVWARFAWYLYVIGFLMLALVIVHGHSALGAQRWIQVGSIQIQPSEFAKLIYVVTMAVLLTQRADHLDRWRELAWPAFVTLVYFGLVFKQPDLGTGLIFILVLFGMLFLAGVPIGRVVLIFGGGLGLAVFVIWLHLTHHVPIPLIHAYQLNRLLIFLNPQSDPTGNGWNIIQSRIALGSGGLFGTGLLHGQETQLAFLPEPFTDFIFSSLAEQLGFVGAASVLVLYVVLVWRLLVMAAEAPDTFGTLIAGGVAVTIASQALMNVGMAMGVLPVVGIPLPLLSAGGSSLVTTAAGLGLAVNVGRQRILARSSERPARSLPAAALHERSPMKPSQRPQPPLRQPPSQIPVPASPGLSGSPMPARMTREQARDARKRDARSDRRRRANPETEDETLGPPDP